MSSTRHSRRGLTDLGSAQRLIDRHGDQLRYVHGWGSWHVYDGTRWQADHDGAITRYAVDTVNDILDEDLGQDAVRKHARDSQQRRALTAMIALARDLQPLAINHAQLDADPWVENRKPRSLPKEEPGLQHRPSATGPSWWKNRHVSLRGSQPEHTRQRRSG